jgi:hypothetical protein
VLLVGSASACWVTLDPILDGDAAVDTADADAAGKDAVSDSAADAATSPPETCTVVETASSEYSLCADPKSFSDAVADCATWNAELAAIGSELENEFLAIESYDPIGTNLWVGGNRDDELVWRWQDGSVFWRGGRDGAVEPGAYAKWAPGEPNDSSTVVDEPERCLALTMEGYDWNDRACSLELAFACERPQADTP